MNQSRLHILLYLFGAVLLSLVLLFLFHIPASHANKTGGGIEFSEFHINPSHAKGNPYLATVYLRYNLTNYLQEGLQHGMTLKGNLRFSLTKKRRWWLNKTTELVELPITLKYHSLSRHYQVVREDTGEHWNFSSLPSALDKMGRWLNYPIPNLPADVSNGLYVIKADASLSPESFKLPLRLHAIFVDKYSLNSKVKEWPLR